MNWNISLDNATGGWTATATSPEGDITITQPRLKDHDHLTRKAFARAIMLRDKDALLASAGTPEQLAVGELLFMLRAEGFNQQ